MEMPEIAPKDSFTKFLDACEEDFDLPGGSTSGNVRPVFNKYDLLNKEGGPESGQLETKSILATLTSKTRDQVPSIPSISPFEGQMAAAQ